MVKVKDLLKAKGHLVYSISANTKVYDALQVMSDKKIGALVVYEGEKMVGVISERDYARRVILKGKHSKHTQVRDIMATDIICVNPEDSVQNCMALMTAKWVRHMPVMENGQLVGMISIGDIVKSIISSQEATQAVINSLLRQSLEDVSLDNILKRALDLILSISWLAFEKKGGIFLVENGHNVLVMKVQKGLAEPIQLSCARLPFGKCLCGRAAMTKEIIYANSVDDRHDILYEGITPHGHYCVPICYKDEILGVINLYLREGHQRNQGEEDFLIAIANTLSGIIMRKRLEKVLVRSEKLAAVGQTVASLAHCIKGILFGLEGGVYVVDKAFRKNDMNKLHTGWNMVRKNINNVSKLVLDLLEFPRERKPEFEICSPNIIAEEVCELMELGVKGEDEDEIEIIRNFDPDLKEALLDPESIHRCLLNLVSNALDACRTDDNETKHYKVRVTTRQEQDGKIIFQVSDNGCGIDEEVEKNMFTSFFTTKGTKGTGLGLLITQQLIQDHEGTISANSEPGVGSTFTISLPNKQQN
jgi:signal transduction histidine kinase/predicted transcriptional regulator